MLFEALIFASCRQDVIEKPIEAGFDIEEESFNNDGFIEIPSENISFVNEQRIIDSATSRITSSIGKDWSGLIEVKIFKRSTYPKQSQNTDVTVSVPSGYVCIGGGANTKYVGPAGAGYSGYGALLTASYPSSDKKSWIASSKDQHVVSLHELDVYAIGLRIAGISEEALKNYIIIQSATSVVTNKPAIIVSLPRNYTLVGGGAKVNLNGGYGNLLVESRPLAPLGGNSWIVSSKDHIRFNPTSITAYAIGILEEIPNFGAVQSDVFWYGYTSTNGGPSFFSARFSSSQYAFTGYGARSVYRDGFNGAGRMLTGIRPFANNYESICTFSDKDHKYSTGGTLYGYIVGLKKR